MKFNTLAFTFALFATSIMGTPLDVKRIPVESISDADAAIAGHAWDKRDEIILGRHCGQ